MGLDRARLCFMIEMEFSQAVLTALIEGLLQDQADEVCLDDEAALLRYAYRVAGTVGLLMCDVLDCRDANAKAHANGPRANPNSGSEAS